METEKLTLSENKCHNIHIGQQQESCKDLKVQNKTLHESQQDKYLGDNIVKSGTQRATINIDQY